LIADRHWTYGDVIFCELVVEVVYADLASVAEWSQRLFVRAC